jgi:hypothetical protein
MNDPYKPWTAVQRLCFRFFCCLFIIYIFPFPLNFLTYFMDTGSQTPPKYLRWYFGLFDGYNNIWHMIVPWIGDHLLKIKEHITVFTNGSGDTRYDYVLLLTFLLLSLMASIFWTIIDRKRRSYRKAYYWLRVLVRYNLAAYMLTYGFYKVYHLQMPGPNLYELVLRFGNKSPMGLIWSVIGYSPAYSAFAGWSEVIGGVLLFFRRTTTLGALILVAVLSNVVAINYCYDVPVKLFSSMLLIMDIFLLLPVTGRLLAIFILNKPTLALKPEITWNKPRSTRLVSAFKWVFIIACTYGTISTIKKMTALYGDLRPIPRLYGIYDVQTYIRNKDTIPPLLTDTSRWKQLIVQTDKYAVIYYMDEKYKWMRFEVDSSMKNAVMYPDQDTMVKSKFVIRNVDSLHLAMDGTFYSDSLHLLLKKVDPGSFLLESRKFSWINEYPFNR